MDFANAKDKILRFLLKQHKQGASTGEMAKELNIQHSTVFMLCNEMDDGSGDGNVFVTKKSTMVDGFFESQVYISHKGIHFAKYEGYRWKWFKRTVIDFPKTFWWLIAIFTFMIGRDFKCSSKKESTLQVQQPQPILHIVRDTCLKK